MKQWKKIRQRIRELTKNLETKETEIQIVEGVSGNYKQTAKTTNKPRDI